jgi:hypothetical protein
MVGLGALFLEITAGVVAGSVATSTHISAAVWPFLVAIGVLALLLTVPVPPGEDVT